MTKRSHTGPASRSPHYRQGVFLAVTTSALILHGATLCAQQERPDSADSAAAASLIRQAFQPLSEGLYSRETEEQAISRLQQGTALARRARAPLLEVQALYWISYFYRRMGASDSALYYGAQVRHLGRVRKIDLAEGTGLFAMAQAYADMERIDSLAPLSSQALNICKAAGGCWFENQLFALMASWLYRNPSDLSLFRGLISKAQMQHDTIGLARLYDAMGHLFTERLQQYDSALVYHRRVLQLNKGELETLYGIGRAFRGLRMPDSAWDNFTTMLHVARQVGDLRAEGYALGNLGGICHRDLVPPRLGCALTNYDSAASVASQVLRQAGEDMNRVVYGEQANQIYSEWPFAWLSAADTIGAETATLAALAVAELGRSDALRDLMLRVRTRERLPPMGGMGGSAVSSGRWLVNALPAAGGTLSYVIQADTVLAWLTLPTREVRVYRWPISFDSLMERVSAFRSDLGADDALAGSRLRGIARGIHGPRFADPTRFNKSARRLARVLIPQDLNTLLPPGSDLVLVPQNVLNLVPFNILPIANGTTLGERYAIRYMPSLMTLIWVDTVAAIASRSGQGRPSALVVSNPAMPVAEVEEGVRMRLSQLAAADSEGSWVASRLGARWLSGAQATESSVRREMARFDIIHFATHALAYAYYNKVRSSFLALTPDSTDDGLLTVGEIMDDSTLSLHAKLIVLSACQTALGSVTQAEGTIGLQRAFLAKGAQSLLVSLWSVDDEATEVLMKSFYNHWLGDRGAPTKAEALRRAQRDVRMTARFRDPVYWAAFQLVGAN